MYNQVINNFEGNMLKLNYTISDDYVLNVSIGNGHPWLKGFENAFCSDGLKFNGNSFSKSLKDIVKYIQKYNLKYNTKYNKILIYFQFSEEEENKKYLKNFLQVIKDNKEYFIYEFKRNN